MKDAGDVDVDHAAEGLWVDGAHRAVAGDPGVCHDHVDRAEALDSVRDRRPHVGELGHVAGEPGRAALAKAFGQLAQRLGVEVDEHHFGAAGHELGGGRSAHAAGAACDQRHLALHSAHTRTIHLHRLPQPLELRR